MSNVSNEYKIETTTSMDSKLKQWLCKIAETKHMGKKAYSVCYKKTCYDMKHTNETHFFAL